jgi:hypothetical protein
MSEIYVNRIVKLIEHKFIGVKGKAEGTFKSPRILAYFLATHLYNRCLPIDTPFRGEFGEKLKHFVLTGEYLEDEEPTMNKFKDIKLVDLVRDQRVHFSFYRSGELWYETDKGFVFPVPISDIGDATFLKEDKAILFLRYIRKYKEEIDKE